MPNWQKVLIALGASILLHIVIFFVIGLLALLNPVSDKKPLENLKLVEVAVATPTPKPLQILPMESVPMATPTPVISSNGLHTTEKAPQKPAFESDTNLVAGSEKPASGDLPLPSQDGKDRKELAFNTQKHMLGNGDGSPAAPPVMELAPAPEVLPKLRSETSPMQLPKPTPAAVSTPQPTAMPTPKIQPTPPPATPTPAPTPVPKTAEVPLFQPTPVPAPSAAPTPDLARPTPVATPKPVENVAMLATPRPKTESVKPQQPAYQPETEQNNIAGRFSNRDKPGVDAIGTPKGRYEKKIWDAVGGRWYYYLEQRRDLITSGTVVIRFYINQKGEVEDLKIISNDSNEALASCSVQAVTEARFLPPPPELAPSLENGRYVETFSFTIYPSR